MSDFKLILKNIIDKINRSKTITKEIKENLSEIDIYLFCFNINNRINLKIEYNYPFSIKDESKFLSFIGNENDKEIIKDKISLMLQEICNDSN